MSLVFLEAGLAVPMLGALAQFSGDVLSLRLYKNNYTPVDGSVVGDFTEADFSGYAAVTPVLTAIGLTANIYYTIDSSVRNFTHNGGGTSNTVYGYYVYDTTATVVLWAERFGAPITMASNGDNIALQLQLTGESKYH